MQPITAPPNRQATTGLVALAATPTVPAEARWEMGFTFDPESCSQGQLLAIECGTSPEKDDSVHPGIVTYLPAALVVADSCTTMDQGRDGAGLASRLLLSRQSLLAAVLTVCEGDAHQRPAAPGRRRAPCSRRGRVRLGALPSSTSADRLPGRGDRRFPSPLHLVCSSRRPAEFDGGRYSPHTGTGRLRSGYTGGGPRPTVGGCARGAHLLAARPRTSGSTAPARLLLLGAVGTESSVDHRLNTLTYIGERAGAAFHGCCQFAAEIDTTPT